jgi:hypothetical protein
MRAAACCVVEAVALGGLAIINKDVARMMESVDDNIKHPTVSTKLGQKKNSPISNASRLSSEALLPEDSQSFRLAIEFSATSWSRCPRNSYISQPFVPFTGCEIQETVI